MMRQILHSLLLITTLSLTSCESPLSDTEITDPGLIAPDIRVQRFTSNTGNTTTEYVCALYDKSLQRIQLKSGFVTVNGVALSHAKDLLGSYYVTDSRSVPYTVNTPYTFIVTLADQKQYGATITTQHALLNGFTAPTSVERSSAIPISWSGNDTIAKLSLDLYSSFMTDTSSGTSFKTITLPNTVSGTYQISPTQYLSPSGTTFQVEMVLSSVLDGTIDDRFKRGRSAVSVQSIGRMVTVR